MVRGKQDLRVKVFMDEMKKLNKKWITVSLLFLYYVTGRLGFSERTTRMDKLPFLTTSQYLINVYF